MKKYTIIQLKSRSTVKGPCEDNNGTLNHSVDLEDQDIKMHPNILGRFKKKKKKKNWWTLEVLGGGRAQRQENQLHIKTTENDVDGI